MKKLWMIVALLFVPAVVLAQTATSTVAPPTLPEDPGTIIAMLTKAFGDKDWMMVAGLLLTAVIGLARLFGLQKLVPKKHTHWLAGGLALATSVALGLMAHASWWTIITTGVSVGVVAVGGWQLIFEPIRNFLKKKLGGDEAPPKEEEKKDGETGEA